MNSTNEQTNEVAKPESVSQLQGWYDNFLSGRRYYISEGTGRVLEFIDHRLLQSEFLEKMLGKKVPTFGTFPDFPNHLLSQLKYK